MGIFTSKEFNSLDELLVAQLEDLYDAEHRLVEALPKMADAASTSQLKTAFKDHLKETEKQVERLEQAFKKLGKDPKRETCQAMKGLIAEGDEMLQAKGDASVKDAALIAAAQRVEHYEMAGYGSARQFAKQTGHNDIAELLQQTLDEEGNADHKLTEVAESLVNPEAAIA